MTPSASTRTRTDSADHPITVHRITLREIRLRLVEPFRISSGETWDRRILLLELEGSNGAGREATAWGECVAGEFPGYGYETIDTARLAIREWLAPRVLGHAFDHPREVFAHLDRNLRGHRMAKAAVEMACWELAARLAGESGEPLARLLGGERQAVATGVSLGIQDNPAALALKGRAALERGYRKVKAKIKPGEDREYLKALRDGLGPDAPLAVDANTAYTVDDFDHLRSLDEFGLMMLEQPLEGGDLLRHAKLQQRIETPLCLDETIDTPDPGGGHDRAGRRADRQHQAGAGRRLRPGPRHPRPLPGGRRAGLVRRHAGERRRPLPQRRPGLAPRLHPARGPLAPATATGPGTWSSPEWTMSDDGMVRCPGSARGRGGGRSRPAGVDHRLERRAARPPDEAEG